MSKKKQWDQLEPTYSSSVRIQDVALATCQKRWTIGRSRERGSGISVLVAPQDDDDDDDDEYGQSISLSFRFLSFSFDEKVKSIRWLVIFSSYLTPSQFFYSGLEDPFLSQSTREFFVSFSKTDSGLWIYHSVVCSNFSLWAQSLVDHLSHPVVLCLVLL